MSFSIVLRIFYPGLVELFIASGLAIVPLAGSIGRATEELAILFGPRLGGFLNATLGNTVELFIAMMAILANRFELVKASIAGSIDSVLVGLRLTELFVGVSRSLSPATRPSKARQCSWPCATIWI